MKLGFIWFIWLVDAVEIQPLFVYTLLMRKFWRSWKFCTGHKIRSTFCLNALTPVISSLDTREGYRLELLMFFLNILFTLPGFRCVQSLATSCWCSVRGALSLADFRVDRQGWHLSVYWGYLSLKAAMCIWIIILETNKPYPSSCSCFIFFSFVTFFRRILLLLLPSSSHFPCSSFPALFLYLFFSYCNIPSLAVMKMCDNAVNWSWIPFHAPVFHSLCCLPRSFGTYQMGGE